MSLIRKIEYESPEYTGTIRESKFGRSIDYPKEDTLNEWLKNNTISMWASGHIISDGKHLYSIRSEGRGILHSDLNKKQRYKRIISVSVSPPTQELPEELLRELNRLHYRISEKTL